MCLGGRGSFIFSFIGLGIEGLGGFCRCLGILEVVFYSGIFLVNFFRFRGFVEIVRFLVK